MPTCSAFRCSYKSCRKKIPGKTIHRFPFSRPDILKRWVQNMRRKDWKPSRGSVLCSDHFKPECFDRTGQIVRLRKDAVPTIFMFPQHLQKVVKERKLSCRVAVAQNASTSVDVIDASTSVDVQHATTSRKAHATAVANDHSYFTAVNASVVSSLKQKIIEVENEKNKKIKVMEQQLKRLKKKVENLSEIVTDLKKQSLISDNAAEMLEKSFSGVPLQVMKRMLLNNGKDHLTKKKYDDQLRTFALTLQFYSTKAYEYVRETFELALPDLSTLRRWCSGIECEPGFSSYAFELLERKVKEASEKNEKVVCALMLDEMSIKKQIELSGGQIRGYVDLGTKILDDDIPLATNALVFMVVSVNSSWKLAVGYFLVNGLSGEERANLVNDCITRLYEIGVVCPSITFDGPSCHFAMAKNLGADLQLPDLVPYFTCPKDSNQKVHIFLDVCHMIKLLRNAWSFLGAFKDGEGNKISWHYIKQLQELQEKEGLKCANKLRKAHVDFHPQKMKVNLAAQVFSASVADALEFCVKDLKLPEFSGCEATVKFIRLIDRLFDSLNSRNPLAKNFKAPLRKSNSTTWNQFLIDVLSYLIQLTDPGGKLLYTTPRKTAVIGLYNSAFSAKLILDELILSERPLLSYILTYKFSQDHIELFFCAVRSRGGWNNNPTAGQFISTFKRLLLHHEVRSSNGNVLAQDKTKSLHLLAGDRLKNGVDITDVAFEKLYDLNERQPSNEDHNYCDVSNIIHLSDYLENVVTYIAGFVVKMAKKIVKCDICYAALLSTDKSHPACFDLLLRKTRGGLIVPSNSTRTVCKRTELCVRRLLKANLGKIPPCKVRQVELSVGNVVLTEVCALPETIFPTLSEHMFDTTPDCNHVYKLIHVVIKCYLKIRLHHICKTQTEVVKGTPIRKKLSKLVLFNNQ